MFFRFKIYKDDKDQYGRTYEGAFKEHAIWCLDTFRNNKPDDDELISYMTRNSPSFLSLPDNLKDTFAGNASFNAYCELKQRFEEFKAYYSKEDIEWLKQTLIEQNDSKSIKCELPKKSKKMTKSNIIGAFGSFFISSIIFQKYNFSFIPAFLTVIVLFFIIKNAVEGAGEQTDDN